MGGVQLTHELSDQAEKNILELTEMIDETFLIVRRRWGTEVGVGDTSKGWKCAPVRATLEETTGGSTC